MSHVSFAVSEILSLDLKKRGVFTEERLGVTPRPHCSDLPQFVVKYVS